jgi:hypothetical protein
MGNFALQIGSCSFLKLRISPWGNLFLLLLCFFSPRRLYLFLFHRRQLHPHLLSLSPLYGTGLRQQAEQARAVVARVRERGPAQALGSWRRWLSRRGLRRGRARGSAAPAQEPERRALGAARVDVELRQRWRGAHAAQSAARCGPRRAGGAAR